MKYDGTKWDGRFISGPTSMYHAGSITLGGASRRLARRTSLLAEQICRALPLHAWRHRRRRAWPKW